MQASGSSSTAQLAPGSIRRFSATGKVAATLICVSLVASASAQAQTWRLGAEGGLAVPTGDLSHFHEAGPAVSVELLHRPGSTLGVGVQIGLEALGGRDLENASSPTLRLWRYEVVGALEPLPATAPVRVALRAGGGATSFSSDSATTSFGGQVPIEGTIDQVSDTFFSAHVGVRIGVQATERLRLFATGLWRWMSAENRSMATEAMPLVGGVSGDVSTVPITLGASLAL